MKASANHNPLRGQTTLEYLLLLSVVAVVVIASFGQGSLVSQVHDSAQGYYNTVTRVIMGSGTDANPAPINGGWCPVVCPTGSGPSVLYGACECPAPAFGGAACPMGAAVSCGPTGQMCGFQINCSGTGGTTSCGPCPTGQVCNSAGTCGCADGLVCGQGNGPTGSIPDTTCANCICPQGTYFNSTSNACVTLCVPNCNTVCSSLGPNFTSNPGNGSQSSPTLFPDGCNDGNVCACYCNSTSAQVCETQGSGGTCGTYSCGVPGNCSPIPYGNCDCNGHVYDACGTCGGSVTTVSMQTDSKNCGRCFNACPSGDSCTNGSCVASNGGGTCSGATPCGSPGACYATSGCDNTCNSTKVVGCDGVCGSGKVNDACGTCGGTVTTVTCNATCGNSGTDSCGNACKGPACTSCVPDGSCTGACGGGTGVDNCGNACTNNTACVCVPTCGNQDVDYPGDSSCPVGSGGYSDGCNGWCC